MSHAVQSAVKFQGRTQIVDLTSDASDDDQEGATHAKRPNAPLAAGTNHHEHTHQQQQQQQRQDDQIAAASDDWDDSSTDLESMMGDELDLSEDQPYMNQPFGFTSAEAAAHRARLHRVGADRWIFETATAGIPIPKLCTVFGIRPFLPISDDDYYQLLGKAIRRELLKRQKLPQYNTIQDAARLLKTSKNIIVVCGAGISTSLGKDCSAMKHHSIDANCQPEEVFTIENFDMDPTTFYTLAGEILPGIQEWSPTHGFIRLLQDKGKLLTNYTQNIDNIESHAGIFPDKLIQCHGSWATATCRKCGYHVPGEKIFPDVEARKVSYCTRCTENASIVKPRKRKRGSNSNSRTRRKQGAFDDDDSSDDMYDESEIGVMKPDITFFGEALPDKFFTRFNEIDLELADLVVVIGTSMKVKPVSEM
ncbi:NAD-dependent histone deacetylase sir2 [Elasticomyces elasticus]|nr:NAD-dependent histone deacetylase sir2 [Elasticomyces elasticus]